MNHRPVLSRSFSWLFAFLTGFVFLCHAQAQTINQAEYFFDNDPGPGNGTPISIPASDPNSFTSTISTTGLLPGKHFLFIRTKSEDGYWSHYETQEFFISSMVKAEYFFDDDPGPGNGTAITIGSGNSFTSTVSTTGLLPGKHNLFVRTQNGDGYWSHYETHEFYVASTVRAEYFFDNDPGVGNGTPIPVTLGQLTLNTTVSTSGLTDGDHFLYVRTQQESGIWSLSDPQHFFIEARIVEAEYFIDTDPGLGNATPISFTAAPNVSFNTSINVGALADGDHYLFVRTRDILGNWSLSEPQTFTVSTVLPIELIDFMAFPIANGDTRLSWSTLSETNNDYFILQHSHDGLEFVEINKQPGHGTTTSKNNYWHIHGNPPPGKNYYRLKQVDYDGSNSFSKVLMVEKPSNGEVSIFPNPVLDKINIKLVSPSTTKKSLRRIQLFDLTGRSQADYQVEGKKEFTFDRTGLAPGVYLLHITTELGGVSIHKIIFL